MEKPKLPDDLLALIEAFDRHFDTDVLTVSANRLNKEAGVEETHQICSSCYAFIAQTWDHLEWCELYEEEALTKWLKKGKNEK